MVLLNLSKLAIDQSPRPLYRGNPSSKHHQQTKPLQRNQNQNQVQARKLRNNRRLKGL